MVRSYAVQTYLAHRATAILSKSLGVKVSIDRVEISFFNNANLVNFYMEDRQQDTMIAAKELRVKFKVFSLLRKKVSVTSIFFEGAALRLHRDSLGNTNLAEAFQKFQSTKKDVAKDAVKKPASFSWDIDLENLNMQHTYFSYLDEKGHLNLKVELPACNIDLRTLDLQKKVIDIKSLYLDRADVSMEQLKRKVDETVDTTDFHFLPDGPLITFGELRLFDSHFKMDDLNSDSVLQKGMDFKHLDISGINLLAQNGKIVQDTIYANVKSLAARERSGFVLNNLTTVARVSVKDVTLDKLNLRTPGSEIKDYLSFNYNSFKDFTDFFNSVKIRAKFSDSKLAISDLNFFVRKLDNIEHNVFFINGEIAGRINNLKGRGIEIKTSRHTMFKGDFYARGLPNIYETSLNVRIDRLATTAEDLRQIYPGLQLPVNANTLGLIYYVGSFDGFVTDFVSKGKLITSIGSAEADAHFLYDKDRNKAAYEGDVRLNEFNVGRYLGDEQLVGKISLQAKVNGKGLTAESLDAELDGLVSTVTFKGYNYKNIKIDGILQKKSFDGALKIEDKNLDMDFDGRADLSAAIPEFRFKANIRKADLKNLNLLKDSIRVAGHIESDFAGTNIDDMLGSVDLSDIFISRDTLSARLKHLGLSAKFLAGKKKEVTLDSDFADAEMDGNFSLKQLPKALVNFANYTFTKDYVDTSTGKEPQDFTLDFTYYEQPTNLTQILLPQLKKLSSSRVTCSFNSIDHKLNVTANIPEITYGKVNVRQALVSGNSAKGVFDFNTSVERVYNNDSLILDSVNLKAGKDGQDIKVALTASDGKHYNYGNLAALFTPLKGEALLRFEPGEVHLGNNIWNFEPGDSIFIKGKRIVTHNLVFRTNEQTIAINSYLKNDTSTSAKVSFENTNLNDFARIFSPRISDFKGIANGNLMVDDIFSNPRFYANLLVKQFIIGKELIGDIVVKSELDSTSKTLHLSATVTGPNTDLHASGTVSIDPLNPSILLDVDAQKVNLNFLNYRFFDKYVKNVKGYAVIKAKVYGTPKKPLLAGTVNLVNDTVTVSFTNTTYTLTNQTAKLDEHGFDLTGLHIQDLKGNWAHGNGRINHESFRDFALDIQVTTDNAQFLNTTPQNSPGFYGVAYGKGNISFVGPINSPVISASATTGAGTYCKMPINNSYETNRYSFYKFVTKGKDNTANSEPAPLKLNGVTFNLRLEVTPDARMDIILDPVTGDVLTGYGHGTLNIKIPKNSNLDLRGDYTIERGSYLFTLQGVITKHFEIDEGGTVTFNGDINKAKLNLSAVYKVRSSVSDLIDDLINSSGSTASASSSGQQLAAAALRQSEIDLLLNITGDLERSNIAFDLRAMDVDPTIKTYVDQKLTLLKNNETELYKQVFGLLVMNRFIPTNSSTSNAITNSNYISGTAVNTVSQFISSQFSNYLSNLLEVANIRNLDVNLGFRQYDQSLTSTAGGVPTASTIDTRQEVQVALTQRLLNNRLSINAGGNLDFGNSSTAIDPNTGLPISSASRGVIPTGDFQIEYSLTPDGAWRAKAFNRTNYDYFNERDDNRTGIGISYRQEFDKPSDLIKKRKAVHKEKREEKKEEKGGTPPANAPATTPATK